MNPYTQSFGAAKNPYASNVGFWPVNKFPPITKLNAGGTIMLAGAVGYTLHALLADDASRAMRSVKWANVKDHVLWGALPAAAVVLWANMGVYAWQQG